MDFNVIGPETQAQVLNSAACAQLNTLKIDVRHLEGIVPSLKEMQQHSGKLVKDYHQYLQKKERKTQGLPYHMIKKFELLQSTLSEARKRLEKQCCFFQNHIRNRQFQKNCQQAFFKKTLKSYDERRKHLKNYILNNESRMQLVEDEVTKNVEYETHKFTVFLSELDVQRLEHNYHPKMDAGDDVCSAMRSNIEFRERIKQKLQSHYLKQQKQQSQKKQDKNDASKVDSNKVEVNARLSMNINSFFYKILAKMSANKMFMSRSLQLLLKQKKKLSHYNQSLKIAVDLCSQVIDQSQLQWDIIENQYKQQFQSCKRLYQHKKLTKTDYYIYLKEIHRETEQKIKNYGLSFQYAISNQLKTYHLFRSKSQSKYYFLTKEVPSENLQQKHSQLDIFLSNAKVDKQSFIRSNQNKKFLSEKEMNRYQTREMQQKLEYQIKRIKAEIQQSNNIINLVQNQILQEEQIGIQKQILPTEDEQKKANDENVSTEKEDRQ